MSEKRPANPLPPEPEITPAGRAVGYLLWLLVLMASVLVVMGIWGVGDATSLLKAAATGGLVVILGCFAAMASRR